MEANAVEAKNLDLVFQTRDSPVHALSEINLEIRRGDFISFIGPSGCGKTTLLRVIADLEKPTGGSIVVNGVSPEQARLKRGLTDMCSSPRLYFPGGQWKATSNCLWKSWASMLRKELGGQKKA